MRKLTHQYTLPLPGMVTRGTRPDKRPERIRPARIGASGANVLRSARNRRVLVPNVLVSCEHLVH